MFGGKLGDHLRAVAGDDEFLLDPRRPPAVRRGPVGLQREDHAYFEHLGLVERDEPAEDRLLPDRQAYSVPELEGERSFLVRESELLGGGPQRRDVRGGRPGFDCLDGHVHVLAAALVGVRLGHGSAADGERPVIARSVTHKAMQDVEERRVTRSHDPVGEDVRVG